MMPVIRIPDPLYKRLQALAVPFEDTPITVIERLVEEYEARQGFGKTATTNNEGTPVIERLVEEYEAHQGFGKTVLTDIREFNPAEPPDLRHTRLISAMFNRVILRSPNWNKLLDTAHVAAHKQGIAGDALIRITLSNAVKGENNEYGFHYLPEVDISIQGVDSNLAWRNTLHLAKYMKVPVEVHFEWRNKDDAAYPGEKGTLTWSPK